MDCGRSGDVIATSLGYHLVKIISHSISCVSHGVALNA